MESLSVVDHRTKSGSVAASREVTICASYRCHPIGSRIRMQSYAQLGARALTIMNFQLGNGFCTYQVIPSHPGRPKTKGVSRRATQLPQ